MVNLLNLYNCAEKHHIDVDWIPMTKASSLSIQLPDNSAAIAIDPWKMDTLEKETVCLAHELGHCRTGAFYNWYAALDVRQKHENRADKWAIKKLVPEDELIRAMCSGYTEIWSLAEYFGVTEDFMRKAVCWYNHGNLNVELYF